MGLQLDLRGQNCPATTPTNCGTCFPSRCEMICGGNFEDDAFNCYASSATTPDILVKGSIIGHQYCGVPPNILAPAGTTPTTKYGAVSGKARIKFVLNSPMLATCSYKLKFMQLDGALTIGQTAANPQFCTTQIRVFGNNISTPLVTSTATDKWKLLEFTITPTVDISTLEFATGLDNDTDGKQLLFIDDVSLHRVKETVIKTLIKDEPNIDKTPCRGFRACYTYSITGKIETATTLTFGKVDGATVVPINGFDANGVITINTPKDVTVCLDIPLTGVSPILIPKYLKLANYFRIVGQPYNTDFFYAQNIVFS